jgi:hypothetical protein
MKHNPLKVIIAGSRTITDYNVVARAVKASEFIIGEVVSGGAGGVDYLGEVYANKKGIPIRKFPAQWQEYGKSAGYRRNVDMAMYSDALIAIWDGESRGTRHMIVTMGKMQKLSYIYYYDPKKEIDPAIISLEELRRCYRGGG